MANDLKYPRTYHLPSSPGLQSDDRLIPSLEPFRGRRVIVTEKLDGECTTLTPERTYARSLDTGYHPSRNWLKAFHARRAWQIPSGWRVSGEYVYARHSLAYTRSAGNALRSFFYGFGVWTDQDKLLDWDATLAFLSQVGVESVPVLYDGPFSESLIGQIAASIDTSRQEGFVVRIADQMPYPAEARGAGRFFDAVAKWVRPAHVTTGRHWMSGPVVPNELREDVLAAP